MAIESVPTLVSKAPAFISIDKTVVANIDELYDLVSDAAMLMEIKTVLDRTSEEDCGTLYRIALDKLNESLPIFGEVFDAVGITGRSSS